MIKIKKIFIAILISLIGLTKVSAGIQDGLFIAIGDKAITKSDIVNEIKVILILNNLSYSDDKRDELQQMAVKSTIKRTIKEIEIGKRSFLKFNQNIMAISVFLECF